MMARLLQRISTAGCPSTPVTTTRSHTATLLVIALDYTAATVAAQQAAREFLAADDRETLTFKMTGGEKGEAELWSSSAVKVEAAENAAGSGTVIVGIASFADNGGLNGTRTPDGVNDPREYIFYVPDSAKEKAGENGAPAIVIYPGNSQTDRIFMDSTMWWKIADEERCCEEVHWVVS